MKVWIIVESDEYSVDGGVLIQHVFSQEKDAKDMLDSFGKCHRYKIEEHEVIE